jgi:hypothetical protein
MIAKKTHFVWVSDRQGIGRMGGANSTLKLGGEKILIEKHPRGKVKKKMRRIGLTTIQVAIVRETQLKDALTLHGISPFDKTTKISPICK